MTSLAHQLKRLALPQNDSNLLSRRVVASVLFDPKDAASMDRSTFYALGKSRLARAFPSFSSKTHCSFELVYWAQLLTAEHLLLCYLDETGDCSIENAKEVMPSP